MKRPLAPCGGYFNDMPEYWAYMNALRRCTCNPEDKDYADYAGRGIKFLFVSFRQFYADAGDKPSPHHMLDRKDNNGNYEPGNVRWVTPVVSRLNQRPSPSRANHARRVATLGGQAARISGQASAIAHTRWHVNRGIIKEGCRLCSIQNQVSN